MNIEERPYVLSIAGFDPSAGAGILADIKTFEACGAAGLGVCSALTLQNDIHFDAVKWIPLSDIVKQIEVLTRRFKISYVKIGIIENLLILKDLIEYLMRSDKDVKIVWDPILSATAGFVFHPDLKENEIINLCRNLFLITPNLTEIKKMFPHMDAEAGAMYLSKFCHVLLKGGHSENGESNDILYSNQEKTIFTSSKSARSKHGTGCVLSAAILANLARGIDLKNSCHEAKKYVKEFIESNNTLLGYHY